MSEYKALREYVQACDKRGYEYIHYCKGMFNILPSGFTEIDFKNIINTLIKETLNQQNK